MFNCDNVEVESEYRHLLNGNGNSTCNTGLYATICTFLSSIKVLERSKQTFELAASKDKSSFSTRPAVVSLMRT